MKPGWWDRPSLCVACRASPFLRPADRRQKTIVCPTGHGAESMSCGWVSGEAQRSQRVAQENQRQGGRKVQDSRADTGGESTQSSCHDGVVVEWAGNLAE